jgi:hypothetical protein
MKKDMVGNVYVLTIKEIPQMFKDYLAGEVGRMIEKEVGSGTVKTVFGIQTRICDASETRKPKESAIAYHRSWRHSHNELLFLIETNAI